MNRKRLEEILRGPKAMYNLAIMNNMPPAKSNLEYHTLKLSCKNCSTQGKYVEFDIYEIKAKVSTLGHDIKPTLHFGIKKDGVEVMPENGWTMAKAVNYLYTYFKEEDF